jgi:hypothetical protein
VRSVGAAACQQSAVVCVNMMILANNEADVQTRMELCMPCLGTEPGFTGGRFVWAGLVQSDTKHSLVKFYEAVMLNAGQQFRLRVLNCLLNSSRDFTADRVVSVPLFIVQSR